MSLEDFGRTYSPARERQLEVMSKRIQRQEARDANNRMRQDALVELRRDPERFMKFVTVKGQNECWPYSGMVFGSAFDMGYFVNDGHLEVASRVMCFLAYDRMVPDHVDVTPTCGDYFCCNPFHFVISGRGWTGMQKHGCGVVAGKWLCDNLPEVRK